MRTEHYSVDLRVFFLLYIYSILIYDELLICRTLDMSNSGLDTLMSLLYSK